MTAYLTPLLLLLLLNFPLLAAAEEGLSGSATAATTSAAATATTLSNESSQTDNIFTEHREPTTLERLTILRSELLSERKTLETLRKALTREKRDEEIANLNLRIANLSKTIDTISSNFDRIAQGGTDIESLEDKETSATFNWQDELIAITRPLLSSLKDITEKPRQIEHLRSSMIRLQQNQRTISATISSLQALINEKPEKEVLARLKILLDQWQQRQKETSNAIEMAEYEIASLQGEVGSNWQAIGSALKQFFAGRGLTLLIALCALLAVWLVSLSLRNLAILFTPDKNFTQSRRQRNRQRAINYMYRLITGIFMVVVMMVVFYSRSDVLLLALVIIAVIMLLLTIRETLPKYIKEIRVLLDFGCVREDERMIYNGIPMEVCSIGTFAILRNPELDGVIRLPLEKIVDDVSRPSGKEDWFSCSVGDFLMLSDGRIVEVKQLTVEIAVVMAASSQLCIPISEFYNSSFRNLSRVGYGIPMVFGIDYAHQAIALDEVPLKMKGALQQALNESEWSAMVNQLLVEFKEAGASSLDYIIYLSMKKEAAPFYFNLQRLIQQTLVRLCNQEQWGIPFAQLTIHQGEGFGALTLKGE
ncbi:MAG: mechanosensitive ion channel [Gammaproteobacteria bacterium]|nr:mechanosensitive ion channel [Gammaproteobacteria bacterium]